MASCWCMAATHTTTPSTVRGPSVTAEIFWLMISSVINGCLFRTQFQHLTFLQTWTGNLQIKSTFAHFRSNQCVIGNDFNYFRFGHSAVLHNGTLVIYGGFNGQTKGDIILFHPGHCAHVKEEDECIASYHGLKCVWNRKKDVCEVWGQTGKKNSASLCSPHTRNNTGVCRSFFTLFAFLMKPTICQLIFHK